MLLTQKTFFTDRLHFIISAKKLCTQTATTRAESQKEISVNQSPQQCQKCHKAVSVPDFFTNQ